MALRSYRPRRAGLSRWLQGAPSYVVDCFDHPATIDRYTVVLWGPELGSESGTYANTRVPYLAMSDAPTHPQGFSQWGDLPAYQMADYRSACGKRRVRWCDLPQHIRDHVKAR